MIGIVFSKKLNKFWQKVLGEKIFAKMNINSKKQCIVNCIEKVKPAHRCFRSGKKHTMKPTHCKQKQYLPSILSKNLFGNTNTTNRPLGIPWKKMDIGNLVNFTQKALKDLRESGSTHIWYHRVFHIMLWLGFISPTASLNDDRILLKAEAGRPTAV